VNSSFVFPCRQGRFHQQTLPQGIAQQDAGFDMHLVKPIELDALIQLLSGIEKRRS